MQTILVVDDKTNVRTLLREYLTEQGYRVVTAENGRIALFTARQEKPDLILLDIMMPEMDGYTFMRTYRQEADAPIILLTAKLEETDKVLGLELGADDYVTKPFGMRELTARVRAVLRRVGRAETPSEVLRVADVVLDKNGRRVTVADQDVQLTPSEFDLLAVLMASPGRAFSRLELLENLQGMALEGAEKTINVHVRNLRTKIEPDPANPRYVETVFGVGYRFCME
ncbi:MAG: response regulator transcription factor [Ardenticatenaceae bacterium]|nr:response regulator transcription factor [Ardenticatenaceae bacterium]